MGARARLGTAAVAAAVQAGYTILFGRWALSGGGGGSYGIASEEAPDGSARAEQLPHRGFWLNFRLNAGVAF